MDWKREAADKLKCYEAKRTSLERAREEMRRLEDDMTRIRSATTDGTPVSGGTSTREDATVNNITRREELKVAMREAAAWVKIVDGGLAVHMNRQLQALMGMLDEAYPSRLNLNDQGIFQLGYYHQRQKRFEKKEEKDNG